MAYNDFNQTTKVETFDGNIQINRYDAEGLRYEMEKNGQLVQFIFNTNKEVIAEKENEWTIYISGSEILASSSNYDKTYYHYANDEMGSCTHIVDDKEILNQYEYDAWGNVKSQKETVKNRFKFNGQQLDHITQQYYLRARFYNPVIARFTQEDTYRGDGLNLYAYCANNPVYYVDPSGNSGCPSGEEILTSATTVISEEMREKILLGKRKYPKNELIGGHSPAINNENPRFAVEILSINKDGTQEVKFLTQFSDNKLSKIKKSTLFPKNWTDDKIIESIIKIGDSKPIGIRNTDKTEIYRGIIDGVEIEVMKIGSNVTSAYPTGGKITNLSQFTLY